MEEKNTVDQNEVEEVAAAPEEHGFHEVGKDDSVLARSSGDYDENSEVDQEKVDYFRNNPPTKYEGAAQPLQSPLQTAPERHQHTAHDEEARDKTVNDADFDVDESKENNE